MKNRIFGLFACMIIPAILFGCASIPPTATAIPTAATASATPSPSPVPPTATATENPLAGAPEGATGKNDLGWTRETQNETEVWVPVQLAGDAEHNIQGHWYETMGQFPLVDSKLNTSGFPDSVFMSVLVKDGYNDALQEGKLIHTTPDKIDDNVLQGNLTHMVLLHLYLRYYPDKNYNDLFNKPDWWNTPENSKFEEEYNNKTLSYTVYQPTDVKSSNPEYTQFQYNPLTDNFAVVRVKDEDLDTSKDTTIWKAGGDKIKYVKEGNILYALVSTNRPEQENELRWLYLDPFFFLTTYEHLPTKVSSWLIVGPKGYDLPSMSGFANPGRTGGESTPPYFTFETKKKP